MCVCLCVLIAHFSKPHSQVSFGGKFDPLSCISCIVDWQRLTAPVPVLQWLICVRLFLVYGFCLPASIVRVPGPAKPHRGLSLLLPYSRIWHQGTLLSLALNSYLWLSSGTLCPEPCLVPFHSVFLDLESCLTFGSNTSPPHHPWNFNPLYGQDWWQNFVIFYVCLDFPVSPPLASWGNCLPAQMPASFWHILPTTP